MLLHKDYLRSQCGNVELVNVELTDSRVLCGWAFIEAWCPPEVVFRDDRGNVLCTLQIPMEFQGHPAAIAVSSPEDDLLLKVKKDASSDY